MPTRLARLSARLNRSWVKTYTRGLPPRTGAARREELYAEILESESGAHHTSSRETLQSVTRVLRGVPSDLVWRREAQLGTSARTNALRRRPVGPSQGGRRPRGPGL